MHEYFAIASSKKKGRTLYMGVEIFIVREKTARNRAKARVASRFDR